MVGDLSVAVEDALKQSTAQAILPPCVLPALSVADMLCGLQAYRLPQNLLQAVQVCQRSSEVSCIDNTDSMAHLPYNQPLSAGTM